ncbi:glycosyltransferase family 2 protein [Octadecabacter arcticus]|uniref:glycosyltransferase family 2 protein n=1 Tax=Octadecabacter arcticus TaxID=53946 RepID=UPI0009FF18E8
MKNESLNIKEWIEHYLWQGIEQIYLIDNGSTDLTLDIIRPWVESGQAKIISLTKPARQRLDSSFKCNTQSPLGIGCCDGHTKQAPQQRGPWRDISRA